MTPFEKHVLAWLRVLLILVILPALLYALLV